MIAESWVTGSNYTSYISVNGEYTIRVNKPLIIVKFNIHFTVLLGMFGLLVFTFVVWYLLKQKNIIDSELILLIGLILVDGLYVVMMVFDLNKTEKEIQKLIL